MIERLLNLVWILLGCAAAWHAWGLGLRGPSGPESGLFPFIASCMIAALGVTLWLKPTSRAAPDWPDSSGAGRAVGVIAGIALMAAGMDYAGFVLSSTVTMLILLRAIDKASWAETLMLTAGSVAAVFFVFGRLLGMPLPRGPWGW